VLSRIGVGSMIVDEPWRQKIIMQSKTKGHLTTSCSTTSLCTKPFKPV
jgi:hypothetical protein